MEGKRPTTRLFLGLWPEAPVREALRAWRDAWGWPHGASPVADDKLHMTLHFLGNQPSDIVPALTEGLAVPMTPFRLDLGHARLWPHGIAVLEPFTEPDELLQLHADLGQALVRQGLALEQRKYRPHVTMARRAVNALVPTEGQVLAWQVDRYALVESRDGAYRVLNYYS